MNPSGWTPTGYFADWKVPYWVLERLAFRIGTLYPSDVSPTGPVWSLRQRVPATKP